MFEVKLLKEITNPSFRYSRLIIYRVGTRT